MGIILFDPEAAGWVIMDFLEDGDFDF